MYSTTGLSRVAGFFTTHPRQHPRRITIAYMLNEAEARELNRRRVEEFRRRQRIKRRGGNGEPMTRSEAARIARAAQGPSGMGGDPQLGAKRHEAAIQRAAAKKKVQK